jgi:uncharacterized tellurite resistance protein B-like protein
MLKALKTFLDEAFADEPAAVPGFERRNLALAVASLLHEATRVDLDENPAEHAAARRALADLCGADEEEAAGLLAEGRSKAERLTSYFAPVSVVKRDFSLPQRIQFVEHLWRVAYADGRLDQYEDHFVRKIAHLLYVPNTQTMVARSRAQKRM